MPPAAVYVLAIVSTVGAALAFKQFVYDPHLSHVVRRWRDELRQWRRRQVHAQHTDADGPDVDMQQRERPSRIGRPDDTAISSSWDTTGTRSSDGLLPRSRLRNLLQEEDLTLSSIELDNLIARELSEWRNEMTTSGQDLRQRAVANNDSTQGAHHPLGLEEDTKPLPYVPLSPRKTHVVANSGSASPATPVSDNPPNELPSPPLTTISTGMRMLPPLPSPPQTVTASPLIGTSSLSGSITGSQHPLMRRSFKQSQLGEIQVSPNPDREPETLDSVPPPISHDSPLHLSPNTSVSRPQSPPSGPSPQSQAQEQNSPSPFLLHVPSLSQSYPQELEIEHGLELLSPPSSRPDSPFTMANISPRSPALHDQNPERVFCHPTSSLSFGSSPSEVFSPVIPLEMGLGNESFDTLSPVVGPRQLALRDAAAAGTSIAEMYPAPAVASDSAEEPYLRDTSTPVSRTSSLKSGTYHSFSESESGNEEDDDDVPLSTRRASLILAISDHSSAPRNVGAEGDGQGLGLTFVPPSPGSPPAPLNPSILSPRSRLAEISTSGNGAPERHVGPLSDTSELSDLDLMSDYSALSELGEVISYQGSVNGSGDSKSGGGNTDPHPQPRRGTNESTDRESDASWSVAGGSDFGDDDFPQPRTPQLRPVGDDTIRSRKKL